ncbi:succinate dehydrogenase, hydrophobic membrane anchor protein [Terrihabitans rhizophilus]|uniref:Succinate dehydrogenase hydrophobic membrane anchor subunit n=1 Tax=Terrihabitans rhizophilus TaxID=3092662 RepID=A0ABU4RMR0_9HYPH|nr:succinate dehydrogenase, hydrophobic membrane anchor protein [Terrihabitans sp. PJ23]MDX6806102.1 succinate dehydrogenase, hydrophobic membrane anchor protein [Terrihabitans sp. PJ23]
MVSRTTLARVRGHGASGSGTREYWHMKVTSYALLPLTVFLIGLLVTLAGADHATVVATLSSPVFGLPLFLFILCNAVHMQVGMQNVIDDYAARGPWRKPAVLANIFFSYGASAAAAYFLLKLSLGQ